MYGNDTGNTDEQHGQHRTKATLVLGFYLVSGHNSWLHVEQEKKIEKNKRGRIIHNAGLIQRTLVACNTQRSGPIMPLASLAPSHRAEVSPCLCLRPGAYFNMVQHKYFWKGQTQ